MSINFEEPMNEETRKRMKEMFAENLVAQDPFRGLVNNLEVKQSEMKELANIANQPVSVELHGAGEIKTMSDGTQYKVTPEGWKKIEEAKK